MNDSTRAWLLDWPLHALALAPCEVIELVDQPEVHRLPFGPSWCRAVLHWRDTFVPLALPHDYAAPFTVVIVAFQTKNFSPLRHAAIPVRVHPRQIDVIDGLDCELPADLPFETSAIRACFRHDDRHVLVPDLSTLFGDAGERLTGPQPP